MTPRQLFHYQRVQALVTGLITDFAQDEFVAAVPSGGQFDFDELINNGIRKTAKLLRDVADATESRLPAKQEQKAA